MSSTVDFEAIYSALFKIVTGAISNVGQIKIQSRALRHWDDVPPAQQPAVFMTEAGFNAASAQHYNMPTIWRCHAKFYLYAQTGNQGSMKPTDEAPSSIMNPLLRAIITAVQPQPGVKEQDLGGLVTMCRVQGEIITDEGMLGSQAVMIVPVFALVAG